MLLGNAAFRSLTLFSIVPSYYKVVYKIEIRVKQLPYKKPAMQEKIGKNPNLNKEKLMEASLFSLAFMNLYKSYHKVFQK